MTSVAGGSQKFSFGYHLNSWDLGGLELEPGLRFLAQAGFGWFEALSRDGFSNDFARRYMHVGHVEPPVPDTDLAWLERIALFSKVQQELGLKLSSLYCNVEVINPRTFPHERDCLLAIARMLHGFDAPGLVLGGGPSVTIRGRQHPVADYEAFAHGLGEIGEAVGALGMWTAYHPHLDTFVETRAQLDQLMDRLDTTKCGLCVDPAHLVLAGSDPVGVVRDYGETIRYMHYKDTRTPEGAVGGERYAAFCELGAGEVDLKAITAELLRQGYDGLVIVELDISEKTPEQSANESVAYLRGELHLELTP